MYKYKTNYSFYEENINGNFDNVEPHEYYILTPEHPTAENDLDVLFECLEVERISCKHIMVEKTIIDANTEEYIDSDEAIIDVIYLAYTQELSSYFDWNVAKGMPPIYKINREKSKIIINV